MTGIRTSEVAPTPVALSYLQKSKSLVLNAISWSRSVCITSAKLCSANMNNAAVVTRTRQAGIRHVQGDGHRETGRLCALPPLMSHDAPASHKIGSLRLASRPRCSAGVVPQSGQAHSLRVACSSRGNAEAMGAASPCAAGCQKNQDDDRSDPGQVAVAPRLRRQRVCEPDRRRRQGAADQDAISCSSVLGLRSTAQAGGLDAACNTTPD